MDQRAGLEQKGPHNRVMEEPAAWRMAGRSAADHEEGGPVRVTKTLAGPQGGGHSRHGTACARAGQLEGVWPVSG